MKTTPSPRLLLLALAGAVCGHTLAYTVSYPDRAARQSVLQLTGHAYWHAAIAAAVVGAVWFAVGHTLRHFRNPEQARSSMWPALPALQIAVFAGMEIFERLIARAPLETLFNNAAVGLASQLLVAALLALAVYLLGRAAALVAGIVAPTPPSARPHFAHIPSDAPVGRLAVVPCGSRGPPYS